MKTIIANYQRPLLTFKTVWAGAYGGHYDAIIFFKNKPKITSYTTLDNKTVGCMFLCDFQELYPKADISALLDPENNNRPFDIEVSNFIKIKLEGFWDEDGFLVDYNMHADGY